MPSSVDKPGRKRVRIHGAYEKSYEDDVVNFVPGEVCVVALVPRGVDSLESYRLVRETLNTRIADLIQRVGQKGNGKRSDEGGAESWLAAGDLAYPRLAEYFRTSGSPGSAGVLLPLARAERGVKAAVTLDRANGATTFLGFYQLAGDVTVRRNPKSTSSRWRARRQELVELVREVVLLVNLNPAVRAGDRGKDLQIQAATPNWLTVGASNGAGNGCGSPGGLPKAIAKGHAPKPMTRLFKFTDRTLQAFDDRAQSIAEKHAKGRKTEPSGVVVAVLDTSPTAGDLKQALNSVEIDAADQWLLRLVQQHVQVDGPLSQPAVAFDHLTFTPNWQGPERDDAAFPSLDDFRMADHGLFVAETIYHLAPASEIHLLRVLGDLGVGDMSTIIGTLTGLPGKLLNQKANQRLVVNLSLGAELPIVEKFAPRWFPRTAASLNRGKSGATVAAIGDFRDLIHLSLQEAIAWVVEQGALVVAAVGNDYYISPIGRKEPRYPAAYDSVLGVAAVKVHDAPADYSNLGDELVPLLLNGVATFGGNATLPGGLPGNGPAVTDDPPDAIKGIFSAPVLPLNGGQNQTGWVAWAGTSFATPIISAIAANVWADDLSGGGTLNAAGVASVVRSFHAPGSVGAVPVVEARGV